jgi:hypothetical protein
VGEEGVKELLIRIMKVAAATSSKGDAMNCAAGYNIRPLLRMIAQKVQAFCSAFCR